MQRQLHNKQKHTLSEIPLCLSALSLSVYLSLYRQTHYYYLQPSK